MESKTQKQEFETNLDPTVNTEKITSRLDYEFTKSFIESAESKFQRLDGLSNVGRTFIGGIQSVENFTLAAFGEVAGGAIGMLKSVVRPADKIRQKRKKFQAVNILGAESSESLPSVFRRLFIELGVHIYYTYERQLSTIYLEAIKTSVNESERQNTIQHEGKEDDKRQAIQILAKYAGAACFHFMIENGSKENLMRGLKSERTSSRLASKWRAKTSEKLYYYENRYNDSQCDFKWQNRDLGKKCYVTSYDFFFRAKPVLVSFKEVRAIAEMIHTTLIYDESFHLDQAMMAKIKDLNELNSEQRKVNEDTNLIVKEVQGEVTETKQLTKKTSDMLEECMEKIEVIISGSATNQTSMLQKKIRFNLRDPIDSFTGREVYLQDLHNKIKKISQSPSFSTTILSQVSVLTGLGGIGKTETVRMYIHLFGSSYDHIVWIDAEFITTAETCFRRLATEELQISTKDYENNPKDISVIIKQIYESLCNKSSLLIVFDNAEALQNTNYQRDGIQRFLPESLSSLSSCIKPVILITSRNQDWGHSIKNITPLDLLDQEECISFALKQLLLEDNEPNRALALQLGQLFDRFPLALQSAVAVIRQQRKRNQLFSQEDYSIQDLINDYTKEGKRDVLTKSSASCSTNLLLIWNVTLKKIKAQEGGTLAIEILNFIAYLSPTRVPKGLLYGLFKENAAKTEFINALELLTDYSLVKNCSEGHLSIHRVIQDVTIEQQKQKYVSAETKSCYTNDLVLSALTQKLQFFWPKISKSTQFYDHFLENLLHVTEKVTSSLETMSNRNHKVYVEFLEFVADEIMETRMEEAANLFQTLTEFSAQMDVDDGGESIHRKKQRYKSRYIDILRLKGEYDAALGSYKELLEQSNEDDDDDQESSYALETKHGIACVLESQGRYSEAKKIYLELLEVRESQLGPYHHQTLATKHNIAGLLYSQNEYQEAFRMASEVLKLREEYLGSKHPETLATKHLMASLQDCKGEYGKAIEMYVDVLQGQSETLGGKHPDTLGTKDSLASVLYNQGRYTEALGLYKEVLEIREKVQGSSHPDFLKTKFNMACTMYSQGESDGALRIFREVLQMQEKVLGAWHPDTLATKKRI